MVVALVRRPAFKEGQDGREIRLFQQGDRPGAVARIGVAGQPIPARTMATRNQIGQTSAE